MLFSNNLYFALFVTVTTVSNETIGKKVKPTPSSDVNEVMQNDMATSTGELYFLF